jgi:hypothetical protein
MDSRGWRAQSGSQAATAFRLAFPGMPEYGIWLEQTGNGAGVAFQPEEDDRAPDLLESDVIKFVWRGSAASREDAHEAARAAWVERFGAPPGECHVYIVEIEPGDSGYRGD